MALELGIFLPVTNNGWVMSPSAPATPPTFALNRWIAQEVERRGFHFLLAQSVWRGHGGRTGFWDTSLEGFTLMSALAAVTERLGLVASVQPLLYLAPVVAKMVATADDVSQGRFGINVVAGANLSEAEQMGVLPENWGDIRYDYAAEWIGAVKRLWGDEPRVDATGEWVNLTDCVSKPKPRQLPGPPVVCAGTSAKGMAFAIAHGTHAFIGASTTEELRAINERYKQAAADAGRTIKTYTAIHYLIADTDEQAEAIERGYRDDPDTAAVEDFLAQYTRRGAGESLRKLAVDGGREQVYFGGVVGGSPATIARHLQGLDDAGLDGVLVMFTDWRGGLARFCDEVVPLAGDAVADPEVSWARPRPVVATVSA